MKQPNHKMAIDLQARRAHQGVRAWATLGWLALALLFAGPKAQAADPPTIPLSATQQGPKVTTADYGVWLQQTGPATLNTPSSVDAVLVPHKPFKCNLEYPTKFVAAPSERTVIAASAEPLRVEANQCTLRFSVTPNQAGLVRLEGTLKFSVCTPERCLVRKHPLSLDIDVQP